MNADSGYYPVYLLARTVYRVKERPYLLGRFAESAGFAVGKASNRRPSLDRDVVRFLRREQLTKLRRLAFVRSSDGAGG